MGANIIELYPSGFVENHTNIYPYYVEAGYHPAENTATNSNILFNLDATISGDAYYTFDTSAFLESLPDSASIKSVICRVNINHSNGTPVAAYVSLSNGTSPKGNSVNFSTSPEIITLDGGEWTRDELKDIRVRIYIKGFTGNVYFYGATLTIEYEEMQVFVANQNFNGVWEEMDSVWECYNGVWTELVEGYESNNGIWNELTSLQSGTPVSTLAKDTSVYVNMDGAACEWYIVYQGNPNTSLYDSSCNGTWLIPKNSLEERQWNSTLHNDYENSDIHKYLNGDFLNKFDSGFRNIIKQVKIPYRPGSGNSSTVLNGSSGLSTKLFLPSSSEWSVSGVNGTPNIGGGLKIYKKVEEVYWLRSPYFYKNNYTAWYTTTIGTYGPSMPSDDVTSIKGLRPLMIIPSDTMVDDNMNILA